MRWTLLPLCLAACATRAPQDVAPSAPLAVWIDADVAVGEPHRDVDDGVAILQALHSPELDVRAVSTVFGNAPLERADPITRALLTTWGASPPVFRGAAAAGQADTDAVPALIAALEAEPLTLLVLGPATNVAQALLARPDLVPRVSRVVAVAGRRPGQRFTTGTTETRAHRDFNFEKDPDAFQALLDLGVPLVLAPWALSAQVWIDGPTLDRWATSPRSAALVPAARGWLDLWRDSFGVQGFNPFDTLAVGLLVRPDLITCEPGAARIVVRPNDVTLAAMQGTDVDTKPFLEVRPPADDPGGAPVTWCDGVQAGVFTDDLTARLLAR